MARALALAARGEGLASPNPMVGAVLVRDGQLIGEGLPHLRRCASRRNHCSRSCGRQCPRRNPLRQFRALLPHRTHRSLHARAHVRRGQARCRRHARSESRSWPVADSRSCARRELASTPSAIRREARRLNEAFAWWVRNRRPLVTLKTGLTLDGSLVLPPSRNGTQARWITSEASRAEVQRMRHASDAIMTGIGTILADDPRLTDRSGLARRRPLLARGARFALASRPEISNRPFRAARRSRLYLREPHRAPAPNGSAGQAWRFFRCAPAVAGPT